MLDIVDTLDIEIVNVQLLDNYIENDSILLGNMFYSDKYLNTNNSGFLFDMFNDDNSQKKADVYEYTIDEILEYLVAELDVYSFVYDVPSVTINNFEWEVFFNILANYYVKNEIENYYIEDSMLLGRMAIASSLVYGMDELNLETYIRSIRYLESDHFTASNVEELTEYMNNLFKKTTDDKDINFDGSIRCIGIDNPLVIDKYKCDDDFSENDMIARLQLLKYNVKSRCDETTNEDVDSYDDMECSNVVDFNKYLLAKKK